MLLSAHAPLYDELLVIMQIYAWNAWMYIFHRMVESVLHVVVFLKFLKRQPGVKMLTAEGDQGQLAELFHTLGLDLLGGGVQLVIGLVQMKVAYLPIKDLSTPYC